MGRLGETPGDDGPEAPFTAHEVGDEVMGTVVATERFGAIVDLGTVEGVITAANLSWRPFDDPSEIVSPGEQVRVRVLDIDHERQRISLGLKRAEDDPLHLIHTGLTVTGTVTRTAPMGTFVRLNESIDGLLPGASTLEPGEQVRVTVIDANRQQRRITLSPASDDDPESTTTRTLPR
nr:S1 RNA-binding domain-containing protein [Actinomadura flavalba]